MAHRHSSSTRVAEHLGFWRNYLDVVDDFYGIPAARGYGVGDTLRRIARFYAEWWSAIVPPARIGAPTNPWPGVPMCCFVFDDTSNMSRKERIPMLRLPRQLGWMLRTTDGNSDDLKDYVHARIIGNFIEIHIENARALPVGEYLGVVYDDEPDGHEPPICTVLVRKTHSTAPPPAAKPVTPRKKARASKKKSATKQEARSKKKGA